MMRNINYLTNLRFIGLTVLFLVKSLLTTTIVHAQNFDNIYQYIENTDVFEENQVEGHTPSIPYLSLNDALNNNSTSAQTLSLNGQWKFAYYEKPEDAPLDFYR
jgi:beta-galactosidase